jgi:hypothetical protein
MPPAHLAWLSPEVTATESQAASPLALRPVSNNDCFLHGKMRLQKCLRHSVLRCPFSPGFFDTASPGLLPAPKVGAARKALHFGPPLAR